MSNWKKTSEELPPNTDTAVLFMTIDGSINLGFYSLNGRFWVEHTFTSPSIGEDEVIAWCPIPKYDLEDD